MFPSSEGRTFAFFVLWPWEEAVEGDERSRGRQAQTHRTGRAYPKASLGAGVVLGPLLLNKLRTLEHRGMGVKLITLELWPVVRLTAPGGNSKWLKVTPLLKSIFAFFDTEWDFKDQPQQVQVRTRLDPSKVSSLLQKCCWSVGTAVQRSSIVYLCVSADKTLPGSTEPDCSDDLSPKKWAHSLEAAAVERALQHGTLRIGSKAK